MKAIFKTTAVFALLLTSAIGVAKNPGIGLRTSKISKSVVLTLENPAKDFTVRITDTDSNTLYFERMNDLLINKKFDLQSLDNGTYFVTTSDVTKTVVFTIDILDNKVSISDEEEIIKPYFRVDKQHLFVNFLNLDKSSVKIKVYDANYRVVFTETVEEEMIIEKAFNFEGAYAGSYSVTVSDKNKTYTENFIVD